jgi:glycosyltransferase involved in cell wall biosynthesis
MGMKSGGPAQSIFYTVKGLIESGINADIVTFFQEHDAFVSNETYIIALENRKIFYLRNRIYKKYLENHEYDIYHTNGIWQYITYITAKIARKKNKPYIITPHGMLYPQALSHSRLRKKIFLQCVLLKDMNKASAIHVTCTEEMRHIRNLGVTSPIVLIPNPVEIKACSRERSLPSQTRIGYLGRIHPRKNIERIIYAWDRLRDDVYNKELVIIGDGDERYSQFLRAEVTRLRLRNVVFTGFLSGEKKDDALQSLSYLIVPSDFENFGMIIPEALINGVPVIASKGTPWEELNTSHCGWWVDNDVNTLTQTIKKALSISELEYAQMGKNGQKLIKEKYSVEVITRKMNWFYSWILNGTSLPDYVYLFNENNS